MFLVNILRFISIFSVQLYLTPLNRTHVSYVTNIRFGVNEKAGRRDFKILDFLSRDRIPDLSFTSDWRSTSSIRIIAGSKYFTCNINPRLLHCTTRTLRNEGVSVAFVWRNRGLSWRKFAKRWLTERGLSVFRTYSREGEDRIIEDMLHILIACCLLCSAFILVTVCGEQITIAEVDSQIDSVKALIETRLERSSSDSYHALLWKHLGNCHRSTI